MNSKPENYIRVLLDEKGTIIEFECNFKEKDVLDISVIGKNWFDTFISANNTKEIEEVFRYLLLNGDSKKWKSYANTIKIGNKLKLIDFVNQVIVKNGKKYIESFGIEDIEQDTKI